MTFPDIKILVLFLSLVLLLSCAKNDDNSAQQNTAEKSPSAWEQASSYLDAEGLEEGFYEDSRGFIFIHDFPKNFVPKIEHRLFALSESLTEIAFSLKDSYSTINENGDAYTMSKRSTLAGLTIEQNSKVNEYIDEDKGIIEESFEQVTEIKKGQQLLLQITIPSGEEEACTLLPSKHISCDELIGLLQEGGIRYQVLKTFEDEESVAFINKFTWEGELLEIE